MNEAQTQEIFKRLCDIGTVFAYKPEQRIQFPKA